MFDDDEPCLPPEPFIKELKRLYAEKYKMSFVDFLINSIPFLDELETGFCDDYKIKEFKRQFYAFARFFIPLENITRVMVNNLKTKEARSEKEDRECYDGKVVEQHMFMNDSNHL